jgi:hypothetical protein
MLAAYYRILMILTGDLDRVRHHRSRSTDRSETTPRSSASS